MGGAQRRQRARDLAAQHGGVVSRRMLRAVGITDADVRAEVRSERWVTHGRQTVAVHTRPLGEHELRWRAVWEVGHRVAALDGVSALQAAGLTGFAEPVVHVSVVHNVRTPQTAGVRQHKVSPRQANHLAGSGIPRVRPPVAAVRAASWAVSDRQGALLLLLPVQQGIVTPAALRQAALEVGVRRRRGFVADVVLAISDGVRALGELDFAARCRARGLPEPDRQVVMHGARSRVYLDVRWRCGLVVEVDGSQHRARLAVVADNLRQNAVTLSRDTVLRIDNIGLLLEEAAFMRQVEQGLRLRGGMP